MSAATKRIVLIVIAVLAVLVIGYVYFKRSDTQVPSVLAPTKVQGVAVEVSKAKQVVFPDHKDSVGTLHAIRQTAISSEIAGRIQKVDFKPGAKVAKGQLLFQLDDRIYQSNLESAQAALELSKTTYERLQKLDKGQVAKTDLDKAKAEFAQDQAKVDVNKAYLAETQIKAPYAGFIGYNQYDVGSQVEPGEALADLVDRSQLQAWYQMPEKYLSRLKLNAPVSIHTIVDGREQAIHGKLIFISPKADPDTHAVGLRALIPNAEDKLSPGLFVHVTQTLGAAQHALAVPEEAIIQTLAGSQVFVVNGNKVAAIKVSVGAAINGLVPVLSGLKTGDLVVTAGQDQLKDGDTVRVMDKRT